MFLLCKVFKIDLYTDLKFCGSFRFYGFSYKLDNFEKLIDTFLQVINILFRYLMCQLIGTIVNL